MVDSMVVTSRNGNSFLCFSPLFFSIPACFQENSSAEWRMLSRRLSKHADAFKSLCVVKVFSVKRPTRTSLSLQNSFSRAVLHRFTLSDRIVFSKTRYKLVWTFSFKNYICTKITNFYLTFIYKYTEAINFSMVNFNKNVWTYFRTVCLWSCVFFCLTSMRISRLLVHLQRHVKYVFVSLFTI